MPSAARTHKTRKSKSRLSSVKHVFISYARQDSEFARELARRLRDSNHIPWQDLRNLRGGDEWQAIIDEALRNAEALIVVMSPYATRSQYVTYEWAFALGAGVRVIPVIRKPVTLHPRLQTIHYVDFTTRRGTPWINLRKALPERPTKIQIKPEIWAQFTTADGKPETERGYYAVRIYLSQPPPGTTQVTYEAHDETLAERKWITRAATSSFEVPLLSNGDVLLTAAVRSSRKKTVLLATTLSEALRRGHGTNPGKPVQRALRKIEEYRHE